MNEGRRMKERKRKKREENQHNWKQCSILAKYQFCLYQLSFVSVKIERQTDMNKN